MKELLINEAELTQKARDVVSRLQEVATNRERTYPKTIDAVLVFSGPGTYYDKLKPDQNEMWRWMDRDRIRAGIAVVRQVTAAKKSQSTGQKFKGHDMSREDILEYGPMFVYNGIPVENEVFRKAVDSPFSKLPKEKVLIIDEVRQKNSVHQIRHTADQVNSFYQEMKNPNSPLYGKKNVALVAHIPDFARNVFYTKKYNDEFVENGGDSINFWVYALKSRPGTGEDHLNSELPRLVTYAGNGHLATNPSPFSV